MLQAYESNGKYAACVTSRGLDYAWEPSIALVPTEVDDGTWQNVWTFPTDTPLFSSQLLSDAHNAAMQLRMNNIDLSPEENVVGLECRKEHPGSDEDRIDRIGRPPGLDELEEAWSAELGRVTSSLPSEAEWRSCIVHEGLPGSTDAKAANLEAFQKYLSALEPDFRVTSASSTRLQSPEWQKYVAAEREFLKSDAACRSATVDEILPKVAVAAVDFAREHAEQISELEAHWTLVRRKASALGWSIDQPLGRMTQELLNQPLKGTDESN